MINRELYCRPWARLVPFSSTIYLTHHDYGKSINGYHNLGVKPALNSQQVVKKTWWVYPAAFSVV
jgi:hypothetical protein